MKPIKEYLYPLLIAILSIVTFLIGIALGLLQTNAALFFFIMSFLFSLVAFTYGIISLGKDILRKDTLCKIYIAHIPAILLSAIILSVYIPIFIPGDVRFISLRVICGTHLSGLGKSILTYSSENGEALPDPNNWCDLMILFADASPESLICPGSDAEIGESSYAMNINLKGKILSQVKPNTVVLFETIYGKDANGRDVTVSSRYSYQVLKEKGEDINIFGENPEKTKVYKNRWNQAGGPEMLTAENHKGKGANILFADTSVRWIPKEDFNNLYWGNEANIE